MHTATREVATARAPPQPPCEPALLLRPGLIPDDMSFENGADFVGATVVEAFVPTTSDFDLQELLEEWSGEGLEESKSVVPFVEQRQFLMLGSKPPEASHVFMTQILMAYFWVR